MKIYSINSRMPFTACLQQVSSENDKKVRRFRLGHLMFTVQLHSWEVDDFDKKSIFQKEELLKEKLPKKIRESLSTENHDHDSKLVANLSKSADRMRAQLEKLQAAAAEAKAKKAEAEAAKAEAEAKEAAEAAKAAKDAADAEALSKMIDAMLTARGVPAAPSAEGQQTASPENAGTQQPPTGDPQNPENPPADPTKQAPVKDPIDELAKKYQELDKLDDAIKQATEERDKSGDKKAKDAAQCNINNLKKARDKLANEIIAMRRPA